MGHVVLRIGGEEALAFGEDVGDFGGRGVGEMVADKLSRDYRHFLHCIGEIKLFGGV